MSLKVKFTYIVQQLPHMLPQQCCHQSRGLHSAYATPKPVTDWLVTIHSLSLPFNGLHLHNPCKHMNYYSLANHGGVEG